MILIYHEVHEGDEEKENKKTGDCSPGRENAWLDWGESLDKRRQ